MTGHIEEMSLMQDIEEKLLVFITRNFMVERDEVDLDKSLVDEGIIDSFGLIEIGTFMETEFRMTVDEDDMVRKNFGSVHKMVDFISRRAQQ